jgi:hypothetical protein
MRTALRSAVLAAAALCSATPPSSNTLPLHSPLEHFAVIQGTLLDTASSVLMMWTQLIHLLHKLVHPYLRPQVYGDVALPNNTAAHLRSYVPLCLASAAAALLLLLLWLLLLPSFCCRLSKIVGQR